MAAPLGVGHGDAGSSPWIAGASAGGLSAQPSEITLFTNPDGIFATNS